MEELGGRLSKLVSFEEKSGLAEPTQLNSNEQAGAKKELSEENAEPIEEIKEKPVEDVKDLNQENKTKNEMSNEGATKALGPKKSTTTKLESNNEDGFDSVPNKQINQHQLVVTISTTSRAHSYRIQGQYKKFGEDDTTLQHTGRWSIGILGQ
jgi:hypothetical protein